MEKLRRRRQPAPLFFQWRAADVLYPRAQFEWKKPPNLPRDPLDDLYRRPGFMLRRAHQIAVSLFLEETGTLRITTTQYGILVLLKHQAGLDQISVAKLLGLDRSTTGMVLNKLEQAGLIGRTVGANDRRKRSLALTAEGESMLERLKAPARRVQERQLSAFAPSERKVFLDLLDKFTRTFNESTRVPLEDQRNGKARKKTD
jgi:DNA-binding MarR family transcriptional regulator